MKKKNIFENVFSTSADVDVIFLLFLHIQLEFIIFLEKGYLRKK